MSRKTAREVALKITFEFSFQDEDASILYDRYLESEENASLNDEDEAYVLDVVEGIQKNLNSIDDKIKAHLKDWNFERISKIDIAILRLAIYEIDFREDIPSKVSINEAVELAKSFSEDSSPSFVNGILAEIIK